MDVFRSVLFIIFAAYVVAGLASAMPAAMQTAVPVQVQVQEQAHVAVRPMDGNMGVMVRVGDHEFNLAFRFEHRAEVRFEGNHMVVRMGDREYNCAPPQVAAEKVAEHIRMHFRAQVRDQNELMEYVAEHLQLGECHEFNAMTGQMETVPCYQAPVRVRAKFLGIIPVTLQEDIQCTATDMNCTVVRPWWAFLTFGQELDLNA